MKLVTNKAIFLIFCNFFNFPSSIKRRSCTNGSIGRKIIPLAEGTTETQSPID